MKRPGLGTDKHVTAAQVRKGQFLRANCSTQGFVWVRITQREKWNAKSVKVHFEDSGRGLPTAQHGTDHLPMTEVFLDLDAVVTVR